MKIFIQNFARRSILAVALIIGGGMLTACGVASDGGRANENANTNKSVAVENKSAPTPKPPETLQNKQSDALPEFKKGEDYKSSVRVKMLKAGWKPAPTAEAEKCGSGDSRCDEYPEMESCAGSGMGNCKFLWKRDEKVVAIFTIDSPYLFSDLEFEKPVKETKSPNLIGKYVYRSKHETGTDEFVYELKANNVAVYTSEQEGGDGQNKTGAWSFDEASKSVTITFPPQKKNDSGIDRDVPEQTFVFKAEGNTLKMMKEPKYDEGYIGFNGTVFKKL
jgi:hypothetical protein